MQENRDNFYRFFEDSCRGSIEAIMQRQEYYIDFIKPIHQKYPSKKVLDIGCGRGEWLRVLKEYNIASIGVDIDNSMLGSLKDEGFEVINSDGLEYLDSVEKSSLIAISSFQVIEHIPFDSLRRLISKAYESLVDGGILILETPNPENIRVACENFYLDPTHTKPIPWRLLATTLEYYGFKDYALKRLHEPDEVDNKDSINLGQIINYVSPDYAIIAQKGGDSSLSDILKPLLDKKSGVSLDELMGRYEAKMYEREKHILEHIDNLYKKIDSLYLEHKSLEKEVSHYKDIIELLQKRVTELEGKCL